ncbi:MAG: NADH-quinone oxidoreductase subunit N [Acidimicrobiia bacterium]|nr:NADH-quinone oxidoreductase subunit N [Acidimicrobiia bacterium]MDH5293743.1 NADH-quinone oxidoreductase subunit N [Acidimicrobiia bacterium]
MSWEIDYLALLPEIVVAVTILAVLSLDLFLPRRLKYWTATVAVLGVTLAAIPLIVIWAGDARASMFDGSFVVDDFALVLKGLFLVAGYITLLMSVSYVESDRYYQGEYYLLLLCSILGSMVMASSRDLIVLFIGLELTTGPLFMLAGWRKGDIRSNEASLKYFILGVLSTAILLWGMSMLFGVTGAVQFGEISVAVDTIMAGDPDMQPLLGLAIMFMLVGFGFKVSAVPFHFWAPDTYEGAPTPVTAYLSVSSKAAGFVALFTVVYLAVPGAVTFWGPALWALAALSMTVANLAALRQSNVVRLLAYSSIAQAGFMLVPFAGAAVSGRDKLGEGLQATVIYLMIYALMNLGAFAAVIVAARRTGTAELAGWAGLGRRDPRLAVLMAIFFFSLAGIPPLAGWFAKFVMFQSVISSGGLAGGVLAVIAAINAVIAFYYYARIAKTIWFESPPEGAETFEDAPAGSLVWVLGVAAVVTILVGVLPDISGFFGRATQVLVEAAGG